VGGQGHQGKVYDISGPEVLSNDQFAAIFSRVLGREIKSKVVPVSKWKGEVPEFLLELLTHMNEKGSSAMPCSDSTRTLTGHQTRFEDWLERNKKYFL